MAHKEIKDIVQLETHVEILRALGSMGSIYHSTIWSYHTTIARGGIQSEDFAASLVKDKTGHDARKKLVAIAVHLILAADKIVIEQEIENAKHR